MERLIAADGTIISYEQYGSGPPLVLVHGGFSDHSTNWEFIAPTMQERFTVYAIARRGRGETDATDGHSVADEGNDVAALIRMIGEPVFLGRGTARFPHRNAARSGARGHDDGTRDVRGGDLQVPAGCGGALAGWRRGKLNPAADIGSGRTYRR